MNPLIRNLVGMIYHLSFKFSIYILFHVGVNVNLIATLVELMSWYLFFVAVK